MLKSMTGFGLASIKNNGYEVTAEIKTLNSKFADVMVRIPSQISSLELVIRKQLIDGLSRGKISVLVEVSNNQGETDTILNEQLLNSYYKRFKDASDKLGHEGSDLFTIALHAPGVLNTGDEAVGDEIVDLVKESITLAVQKTNEFRAQEGQELYTKIQEYIGRIRSLLVEIDPYDKERIQRIEDRLKQGVTNSSLSVEVDQNRFEQELIYYIEKLDINEEKVRLANHLDYFEEIMALNEPNGKKLGFIGQEIGREINTIGSKANSASIQRIVVEMKEELEKIKEQSLNIL